MPFFLQASVQSGFANMFPLNLSAADFIDFSFLFFETESGSVAQAGVQCCNLGSTQFSAATFTSRVQAILLLQPPEKLALQAPTTTPGKLFLYFY